MLNKLKMSETSKLFVVQPDDVEKRTAVLYDPLGTATTPPWGKMTPEIVGGESILFMGPHEDVGTDRADVPFVDGTPRATVDAKAIRTILGKILVDMDWKFSVNKQPGGSVIQNPRVFTERKEPVDKPISPSGDWLEALSSLPETPPKTYRFTPNEEQAINALLATSNGVVTQEAVAQLGIGSLTTLDDLQRLLLEHEVMYPQIIDLLVDTEKRVVAVMEACGEDRVCRGPGGGFTDRDEARFLIPVGLEDAGVIAEEFRERAAAALEAKDRASLKRLAYEAKGLDAATIARKREGLLKKHGASGLDAGSVAQAREALFKKRRLDDATIARKRGRFEKEWTEGGDGELAWQELGYDSVYRVRQEAMQGYVGQLLGKQEEERP